MMSKTEILNCSTTKDCLNMVPPLPNLSLPFNAWIGENAERKKRRVTAGQRIGLHAPTSFGQMDKK
jgi:hypothetical protein